MNADALAMLADEVRVSLTIGSGDLRVKDLRETFGGIDPHRVLTTGEASEVFGYSADTWREWAPDVPGAYRDEGDRAYWRLPYVGCVEHLRALKARRLNAGRRRGPWKKKAEAAQARGARAEGGEARALVLRRSTAMGRRQADDEGPETPRVAS